MQASELYKALVCNLAKDIFAHLIATAPAPSFEYDFDADQRAHDFAFRAAESFMRYAKEHDKLPRVAVL